MLTRNEIIGKMFRTKNKELKEVLESWIELHDIWHNTLAENINLKTELKSANRVIEANAMTIKALQK